jgi:hypothetical protein
MMKKSNISFSLYVFVSLVLFFYTAAANAAEDYQAEISALYNHHEASDDFKMDMAGISGEFFFSPVNMKDHPYAEAAFLERVGSVYVASFLSDVKGTGSTGDGITYDIGVNLAQPGFPLAVQLVYMTSDYDYDAPSSASFESNSYGISIGNYVTDNLMAGVEYFSSKSEMSSSVFPTMTWKSKDYGLFARYAGELSEGKHVSLEGSLGQSKSEDDIESEKNTNIALAADYFFNRALSAGIGIERSSGDAQTEEGMTYTANVRYFITSQFSLQAAYDRFLNSNAGVASDWSYTLSAAVRF